MFVFAFGRDRTVDVNSHPNRDAVTLSWIRQVAHDTEHAVYAIGNQRLVEEAEIPGVVDIVDRHPDECEDWLGEQLPNGRYETFPSRRERLSLLKALHPNAEGYIFVDDADLHDVAGWTHYRAWEFVPAVEAGEVHPSLPGVRDSVSDGGLPVTATIESPDASALTSFLEEYDYGFELTYDEDGTERTHLLHEVTMITRTMERPAAAPAIRCIPVAPSAETFTVRVDAVERLSVVEPPRTLYTAEASNADEAALGLRRLAEANPDAVSIGTVLDRLENDSQLESSESDALRALRLLAQARPEDAAVAVPLLKSLLGEALVEAPKDALATLRLIGDADPEQIAPAADAIIHYLDSEDESIRFEATRAIALIAEVFPEDAVDAVPILAATVEDGDVALPQAIYALSQITGEYPAEVKPVADTLGGVILDETNADGVRLHATATLGRICGEYPATGVDIVDDVATLFDADNFRLRNNAIALVGEVAIVHTDVVEPHVDAIVPLLDTDDTYTRINASAALARIARDFPKSVDPIAERFIDLLADEESLVRENACWALGHLKVIEAESKLEERLSDDDADVRKRADWALHQLLGENQ